jgi:hypothetical protein
MVCEGDGFPSPSPSPSGSEKAVSKFCNQKSSKVYLLLWAIVMQLWEIVENKLKNWITIRIECNFSPPTLFGISRVRSSCRSPPQVLLRHSISSLTASQCPTVTSVIFLGENRCFGCSSGFWIVCFVYLHVFCAQKHMFFRSVGKTVRVVPKQINRSVGIGRGDPMNPDSGGGSGKKYGFRCVETIPFETIPCLELGKGTGFLLAPSNRKPSSVSDRNRLYMVVCTFVHHPCCSVMLGLLCRICSFHPNWGWTDNYTWFMTNYQAKSVPWIW